MQPLRASGALLALLLGLPAGAQASVPPEDSSLSRAVIDRIDRDPRLHTMDLDVDVEDGIVILRGSVPTLADALEARKILLAVDGVDLVDSRLQLSTRGRADRDIEFELRGRFRNNGDLLRADLEITVRGGAVLLRGTVDDLRVRFVARAVAAAVPGVVGIADEIAVAPSEDGVLARVQDDAE